MRAAGASSTAFRYDRYRVMFADVKQNPARPCARTLGFEVVLEPENERDALMRAEAILLDEMLTDIIWTASPWASIGCAPIPA